MGDVPMGYTLEHWRLQPASQVAALLEAEAYLLHEAMILRQCGDETQADQMERRAWACHTAAVEGPR